MYASPCPCQLKWLKIRASQRFNVSNQSESGVKSYTNIPDRKFGKSGKATWVSITVGTKHVKFCDSRRMFLLNQLIWTVHKKKRKNKMKNLCKITGWAGVGTGSEDAEEKVLFLTLLIFSTKKVRTCSLGKIGTKGQTQVKMSLIV